MEIQSGGALDRVRWSLGGPHVISRLVRILLRWNYFMTMTRFVARGEYLFLGGFGLSLHHQRASPAQELFDSGGQVHHHGMHVPRFIPGFVGRLKPTNSIENIRVLTGEKVLNDMSFNQFFCFVLGHGICQAKQIFDNGRMWSFGVLHGLAIGKPDMILTSDLWGSFFLLGCQAFPRGRFNFSWFFTFFVHQKKIPYQPVHNQCIPTCLSDEVLDRDLLADCGVCLLPFSHGFLDFSLEPWVSPIPLTIFLSVHFFDSGRIFRTEWIVTSTWRTTVLPVRCIEDNESSLKISWSITTLGFGLAPAFLTFEC